MLFSQSRDYFYSHGLRTRCVVCRNQLYDPERNLSLVWRECGERREGRKTKSHERSRMEEDDDGKEESIFSGYTFCCWLLRARHWIARALAEECVQFNASDLVRMHNTRNLTREWNPFLKVKQIELENSWKFVFVSSFPFLT